MKITLADIKTAVDYFAQKINAPENLLPTYGQSLDGAHPHIEIDVNDHLYYIIVERGQELRRDLAAGLQDLLYKIFADVTFSMAVKHEGKNRISNEDARRQMFAKQEELLGILNSEWKQREEKEHQKIIKSHPFDDQATIRAIYSKGLRDNGMDAATAWKEACHKYPMPA